MFNLITSGTDKGTGEDAMHMHSTQFNWHLNKCTACLDMFYPKVPKIILVNGLPLIKVSMGNTNLLSWKLRSHLYDLV